MTARSGAVHPIAAYGEAVLHSPCGPVTAFDDELAALVDDMFASMYAADGIGLAANQIGVGLRVFVYDCPGETDDERFTGHVVNPSLACPKGRRYRDQDREGCLSLPGLRGTVARANLATVTGHDRTGAPVQVRATGLLAHCFQHEVDHLDGIVYVDRLPRRQRDAILAAHR